MERTLIELFSDLSRHGGAIVSSDDCSEMEISDAKINGRFGIAAFELGYVRRPKKWLEKVEKNREKLNALADYCKFLEAENERFKAGMKISANPPAWTFEIGHEL